MKIKSSWFAKIDASKSPNLKQYLRGLNQYAELASNIKRPYNWYTLWGGSLAAWAFIKFYLAHLMRFEPDWRE
jgi:hypothetical protein